MTDGRIRVVRFHGIHTAYSGAMEGYWPTQPEEGAGLPDFMQTGGKSMTIYEKIVEFDEEMMVEFLLRFSKDTIDQFSRFQLPSKDAIREFLDRECPE